MNKESGLYPEGDYHHYTSKTKRGECKVKDCKNKRQNGSCRCKEHSLEVK